MADRISKVHRSWNMSRIRNFTPALTPAELAHILMDRAFCKYMTNRQPHDTFRQSKEYRDFRAALRQYLNNTPY